MTAAERFENYADVQRYFQERGVPETEAASFVRLLDDSKYDRGRRKFRFLTTHPQITAPRLDKQEEEGMLRWEVDPKTLEDYETHFYWDVNPARHSSSIMAALLELKERRDGKFAFVESD
jgi:hypothetical protein